MMSSPSQIDTMIYGYNITWRENNIILLLKVRTKSKHSSKNSCHTSVHQVQI
jgi:hypothetical protein